MQKLAEICVRRPVFATMLIMSLVVLGLASYRELGVDLFPKVEFPTVVVEVTLEGASPEEIESQVTKPIEEALSTIAGLDELRSISSEGLSLTIANFLLEVDAEAAAQEVRDKVSRTANQLPLDINPPLIEKIDPDATPILSITLSGSRSLRELTEIGRKMVKEPLEGVAGVGSIDIVGGQRREIQIYVDPEKLRSYAITLNQVRQALRSQNVEVPGGRIDLTDRELVLRTMGRVPNVSDFNELIVAYQQNSPIKISDIGRVEDGVVEPRNLSRLNGTNALTLILRKQSGTNTIEVVDTVKERLERLTAALPAGITTAVIRDQSRFIRLSVHELSLHLILGGLLASLVVLLFMRNFRSALIAAVSIPTSLIATFTFMRVMDFTINNMTLLGLTLAVGIVIDDAIVVLENIFRHVEEGGEEAKSATIRATSEIGLAVMATTLSLVVIFLPVGFMSGIVGRFFSSYGLTMAFAIIVSLLVAFSLTPAMCSVLLKSRVPTRSNAAPSGSRRESLDHVHFEAGSRSTKLYQAIEKVYSFLLAWAMRHRVLTVAISTVVVLSTIPLVVVVGKDFFPYDDMSEFEVNLKLPPGVNLEAADATVSRIETEIRGIPGVRDILTTIGDPSGGAVNNSTIYVRLVEMEERETSQYQAMEGARRILKGYPEIRSSVQPVGAIAARGSTWNIPVNFNLRGTDLAKLEEMSSHLTGEMRKIPGFVDIDTTLESGKPELRVQIDREKAAALGVQVNDVASSLRTYLSGERIGKFRDGDEQYDIRLRVDVPFRTATTRVPDLMIPSQFLGQVELSNLAGFVRDTGPVQIERVNRQRNVTILSNLEEWKPLESAMRDVNGIVSTMDIPSDYEVTFSGRADAFAEAQVNFAIAFVLAVIFMYMVLASQFNSFIHPVTIMLSLPLAVPFAILSLILTRETLNIYSALGLMVLFGIVKKNAILQVDYANTLRSHGLPMREAVVSACHTRLRPILMTTISFVAGMLPIALGTGPGSASRRSIAIVAVGGQTLCLMITLLVTPVIYTLFEDAKVKLKDWVAALRNWRTGEVSEV